MATEAAREFVRLADQALAIRNSDASWETKYNLIFSNEISRAIQDTGIEFDYCDPDTTYEEDVRAFVDAVEARAVEVRKACDDGEWRLYLGCHRGTIASRDSIVEQHGSLEACCHAVESSERFYKSVGAYVWFATAVGPNGEEIRLHEGTPYKS